MPKPIESVKYYVSFDTEINPGKIDAVTCIIGHETITDMDKKLPINLVDHPLYRDLYNYVKANPPR